MRIAFAISGLHGGGAEFVVRQWAEELQRRGHTVIVYTYPDGPSVRQVPGVREVRFPLDGGFARWVILPLWLAHRAQRDDVDVVVAMLTFTNLAAAAGWAVTRCSVPLVCSERNVPSVLLGSEGVSGRVKHWLARGLYRRVPSWIAISHPVAGDLVGGFRVSHRRVTVVPNPVIADDQRLSPLSRRDCVRVDELRVVLVGRLVDQKQPSLFLDALAEMRDRGRLVRGIVIGDGPLRLAMEQRSSELGISVDFRGWQEPWWEAASDADLLLMTSAIEGFGNVLVEAARVGIPCVAPSAALGSADALIPEVTGILAPIPTRESFADAAVRASRLDVSGELVERWLERFTVRRSTDTLLDVLALTERS